MSAAVDEAPAQAGERDAVEEMLPGISAHPHARAVLAPALRADAAVSHAYLFHGPPGTGKREIARPFAAALLSDGRQQALAARQRIVRGTHPDVTWVTPSGAAEMLVADIEEPVVAGATRTPFESSRRVFVIEAVDTMNDQAANRMLKTIEEPPAFVHLLLLTDRREDVLATIASRCQPVRFDPVAAARIAEGLAGVDGDRAQACARLALGDARLAARLTGEQGSDLRAGAERFIRAALSGSTGERPWKAMLDAARSAGASVGEEAQQRLADDLQLLPSKERRRFEREALDARRRAERRARTQALDQMLRLAELWLRDLMCVCEGAGELVYAVDRYAELREDAADLDPLRVRDGIELVQDTRLRLSLNVSEELALEALAYRLQALLATAKTNLIININ
jgi:DNA polymerase III subunit delta'